MIATGLGQYERQLVHEAFARRGARVSETLLATAQALRFGGTRHPATAARALGSTPLDEDAADIGDMSAEPAAAALTPEMQGLHWFELRLEEQVGQLRALLLETEPRWNIEHAHLHRKG